jgi:hypothetical protein
VGRESRTFQLSLVLSFYFPIILCPCVFLFYVNYSRSETLYVSLQFGPALARLARCRPPIPLLSISQIFEKTFIQHHERCWSVVLHPLSDLADAFLPITKYSCFWSKYLYTCIMRSGWLFLFAVLLAAVLLFTMVFFVRFCFVSTRTTH